MKKHAVVDKTAETQVKEYIDYYFELPSELEYIYGEHEPEEIHMREIQESQEWTDFKKISN